MAVLWNAIVVSVAWLMAPEWSAEARMEKWALLCFPAAGAVLALYAARSVARWAVYGRSELVLDVRPAVPGARLSGAVLTDVPPGRGSTEGYSVVLSCHRRQARGARHARGGHRYLLWRDQRQFSAAASRDSPDRLAVPISFRLPEDAPCTESNRDADRIEWTLRVRSTGFIPYEATFEIPVFEAAPEDVESTTSAYVARPVIPGVKSGFIGPGIRRYDEPEAVRFVFSGVRHRALSRALVHFLFVWTALTIGVHALEGPGLIVWPMGLAGAAVLVAALLLRLEVTTLTVKRTGLEIGRRIGPFRRWRSLALKAIQDVAAVPGANLGRRSLYDIEVITDTRRTSLVTGLQDRSRADWLVFQLKTAFGQLRRVRLDPRAVYVDRDGDGRQAEAAASGRPDRPIVSKDAKSDRTTGVGPDA